MNSEREADKGTKKFIPSAGTASNFPAGGTAKARNGEKTGGNEIVPSVAVLRDYILHDIVNNSAKSGGTYGLQPASGIS